MRSLLLFFALVPGMAAAAAPAGMEKVGSAELHKLLFHVYDATLYAPGGEYDATKKHALELTYRMSFDADEIIDRTIDEIRHAQKISADQEKNWRAELAEVIPDVKKGDSITALAIPKRELAFSHNGSATGKISDASLVEPFMNIWLGESTSEPAMRKKLLAKK